MKKMKVTFLVSLIICLLKELGYLLAVNIPLIPGCPDPYRVMEYTDPLPNGWKLAPLDVLDDPESSATARACLDGVYGDWPMLRVDGGKIWGSGYGYISDTVIGGTEMMIVPAANCASNPCANEGTCTDGLFSYTCICAAEYVGTDCTDTAKACYGLVGNAGPVSPEYILLDEDNTTCVRPLLDKYPWMMLVRLSIAPSMGTDFKVSIYNTYLNCAGEVRVHTEIGMNPQPIDPICDHLKVKDIKGYFELCSLTGTIVQVGGLSTCKYSCQYHEVPSVVFIRVGEVKKASAIGQICEIKVTP